MTDREALIEALRLIQDIYGVVRKLAERVSVLEQLALLTPNPKADGMVGIVHIPKADPPFSVVAEGYLREIEAMDLRLTDEEIAEIESEIQSKNSEDGTC